MCGDGCDGGTPIYAWRYFIQSGVVTEEVKFLLAILLSLFESCSVVDYLSKSFGSVTHILTPLGVRTLVVSLHTRLQSVPENVQTETNYGASQSITVQMLIEPRPTSMILWLNSTRMGQWRLLSMFMR